MNRLDQALLAGAVTLAVCAITAVGVRAVRRARRGMPGAAVIGWALLALGFGFPPPPTPQEHAESMNRMRGSRERGGSGTS